MRNRRKPYTEEEYLSNPYIVKSINFENDFPVHLEIGCGKGNFIINLSERNQKINYIGIEKEKQIIVMASKKLRVLKEEEAHKGNLVFLHIDASNIKDVFPESYLERIYLNFSDPWPNRKKWHKKRLTHTKFLDMYRHILKENGQIHLKTDNKELYEFSLNSFEANNFKIVERETNLHRTAFHLNGENIVTEYEKKFSEKGMPIYKIVAHN